MTLMTKSHICFSLSAALEFVSSNENKANVTSNFDASGFNGITVERKCGSFRLNLVNVCVKMSEIQKERVKMQQFTQ